ncbi:MAG: glycosyltransferase family 39 protein [Anaerolineae bacterium]|nr:glycosyltransferase family 39 protein [Anaerolineae bacterium]
MAGVARRDDLASARPRLGRWPALVWATPALLAGLPLAAALLAFGLRVAWLDQQSLWSDELITLNRAAQLPSALLQGLPIEQMPLYFVLLHAWTGVAGDSDFALRFPSVVWGTLTLALLYVLGRRLFGRPAAALGTLLFALNPFQVWYAQDARMYTQLAALSVAAYLALDRALTQPHLDRSLPAPGGRWLAWLAYILASALVLYTHYYAALALVICGLYALTHIAMASDNRAARLRAFALAELGIALLFVPWLPRVIRFLDFPGWREPVAYTLPELVSGYTFGATVPTGVAPWLSALALALYVVGVVSLTRKARTSVEAGLGPAPDRATTRVAPTLDHRGKPRPADALALTLAALAVPALVVLVLLAVKPDFHPRYFIAATPIYSLALAQGILALRRLPWLSGAALAVVLVVCGVSLTLWYTDLDYAKAYYKNYMAYLLDRASPQDALLLQGPSQQLARRYGSDNLEKVVNLQSSRWRDRPSGSSEVVQMVAEMPRIAGIWLATEVPIEGGAVKTWLDQHGYQLDARGFGPIHVWAYHFPPALPPALPAAQVSGPADVGVAWAVSSQQARPDDLVAVDVQWTPSTPMPSDLKVSMRLLDAAGGPIWQRDRLPQDGARVGADWRPGEVVSDRYAVRLPHALTPGVYTWQVVLYASSSGAELRLANLGPLTVGR